MALQTIMAVDMTTNTTSETLGTLQQQEADFTDEEAVCKQLLFLPLIILHKGENNEHRVAHVLKGKEKTLYPKRSIES